MHEHFIVAVTMALQPRSYLELGLYTGETFLRVEQFVERAVGVDTQSLFTPSRGVVKISTTREFFKENRETFDLIFIDADHHFEAVREDLLSSLEILNPYGVILMHDTDPENSSLLDQGFCGDSFRIVDWIIEAREDLNVVTLPIAEAGLSIVQRKRDRRINRFLYPV